MALLSPINGRDNRIRQSTLRGPGGLLCGLAALGALTLWGQVAASREYQLKAVFLYRFTQFVEWPSNAFATPEGPLVIGVLGRNPFGGALEAAVRNERVHNMRLTVEHYERAQDAKNCHLLFVAASEQGRLEEIFTNLKGRSILTVGETDSFVLRGGMIQLITEQRRIRFRINLQAAREARIQISSKLLELAEVIKATGE